MAKGYLQDIAFVDFYDRPIVTAYSDECGYIVPMKLIIEDHLGLDWESMRKKINRTTTVRSDGGEVDVRLFNPVIISGYDINEGLSETLTSSYPEDDLPEFSSNAEYLCLPIDELNLFLAQISLNHVNIDVRENLYLYQKECGAALHDYWFRGLSVNNRTDPSRISSARHDWCPREQSSKSLAKAAARYSAYVERNFDSRVNPEEIEMFAKSAIANVMDIESEAWDDQEGAVVFLLSFMERAAFDILYFSIEGNVAPEDLQDVLERNIMNAWENMGSLIISVQAPFNPFPGVGRGASRELVG